MRGLLSLVLLSTLCISSLAASLSPWTPGVVANFGGPADQADPNQPSGGLLSGSCGYGLQDQNTWPNRRVAAISTLNTIASNATRQPQGGCGACIELQCVGGGKNAPCASTTSITVQVVDSCAKCDANRIIVPYSVFTQNIASGSVGEVPMQYRLVYCTPPSGIVVHVDTYRETGGGYVKLALEQMAGSGALTSVELRKSIGNVGNSLPSVQWTPMRNSYGAIYELSGLPPPPLDLRITNDQGQQLVLPGVITAAAPGKYPTNVQFTVSGAVTPPSTEPLSPTTTRTTPPSSPLAPPVTETIPPPPPKCTTNILDYLASSPDLSQTLANINAAGLGPALSNASQPITLFAPNNAAWAAVPPSANHVDPAKLKAVVQYIIVTGPIRLPEKTQNLPEDMANGVTVPVETLYGAQLTAVQDSTGVKLRDANPSSPDARILRATAVCNSVVNVINAVPLPTV